MRYLHLSNSYEALSLDARQSDHSTTRKLPLLPMQDKLEFKLVASQPLFYTAIRFW